MHLLVIWLGVFGLVYYVRRLDYSVLRCCMFLFALHVGYNVRTYRQVHVFDNISLDILLGDFTNC